MRRFFLSVLKYGSAMLFGLLMAFLLLEVFLRVGFDLLPYGTQGVIQHVRRVPWHEEHLIPPFPYIISREHQARVAPGHHDFPVHWGDAKFHFDTISLWDMPVGFRTRPPQFPVQVVALGDSFTFCWTDFEDCWVEHLHHDQGWSVMDLGIPGTGTLSHQSLINPYVKPLEPQVIVWQWYGNDYIDDYDFDRLQETVGEKDRPPLPDPDPDFGTVADYSAVYRLARNWVYRQAHPKRANGFLKTVSGRLMFFTNELSAYDFEYGATAYGFDRAIETLGASATQFQTELNAPMLILIIPTKEEVYAASLGDELDAAYFDRLSEGRLRLLSTCDAQGWYCLDMTEALTAGVTEGKTIYHAFDFHLDASGNKIVAAAISDYIKAQGWLGDE